jgi:hypothetical protein
MTGAIPYHVVTLHHVADLGLSGNVSLGGEVELQSGLGGFIITHDGCRLQRLLRLRRGIGTSAHHLTR